MSSAVYRFQGFVLDCGARELRRDGAPVALPARVLECLDALIAHRDRAVGRDELARAVFSRDNVSDAQLGQVVLRARRVLGDDGQAQRFIRTVPRFGFRWVAPTREEVAAPRDAPGDATPAPVLPGAAARRLRRLWPAAAAAVPALAVLVAVALWRTPADRAPSPPPAIVLPAEVVAGGEATAAWARLGVMDYLGDRLRRGGFAVQDSERVLALLHGAGTPAERLARARAAVGGWAIASTLRPAGAGWRVELSAHDAGGRALHAEGEHAQLLGAADLAAGRLLGALAGADPSHALALAERLRRAQAALRAHEPGAAAALLHAAPAAQREAPELRLLLAQAELGCGRDRRALAEADAVLASAPAREDASLRVRALLVRGGAGLRLGQARAAERDHAQAIALSEALARMPLLGAALTGRGIARAALGDFDAAHEDLGRARVVLVRSGDRLALARVDAALGELELRRGRPAQALEPLVRAAEAFERHDLPGEAAPAHAALAAVHLQLLEPDRARARIDRAWALRERVVAPAQVARLALGRAEVLLRQGELSAVRALLAAHGDGHSPAGERRRAEALRAELAWRAGDAGRALRLADAALDRWPPGAGDSHRRALRLLREQAALRLGRPPRAEAEVVADGAGARLLEAVAAHAAGDAGTAARAYRAAVAQAERAGVPSEIADVALAYAPWLLDRRAPQDAAALAGRIAPWAARDFDLALLQARLFHALGQDGPWAAALRDARRLAGEREIPPELLAAPAPASLAAR
ncbi:winged helix-turn-helix domain-containing protein [Luteimonas sp. Y-2-2-4F]|nr:winged helix-turn-helix domain-containing protein [Luteimonas sp. Y-2-2-4F]MCD9032243.1 winged helix-turn-helix domain-containing protein [Luteimonas sp. Y-2-2-4F]